MTEAGTPNFRWNFTVNVLDNMLYALAASLVAQETILPLLVSKLSDSPLLIGLIPALYSISYYLPQLFMANHAEGLRRKLPFVVVFSGFLQRLPIPLIGLCLLLFAESNATMALALFFALFAVSAFGGGIVTPAWYTMIGKVVPVRRRGVFFGIANGGGMLMGVGGALFVGRVLEEVAYPNSFAWLFFVAGGILLVSLVCLALTREPPSEDVKRAGNLRQYLRRLPAILRAQHNYRRYLLSYSLLRVSLMSTSFFVVFGEQSLQLGGAEVGLLVAVFIGTQALLQPLMGSLGDRWGHKRNLSLAALSIVLASGCALLAGDIALVALAVSLLACAISCDSVSQYNIVLEFAPTAEQPTYIGLTNSILAPVTFAAPLLGGWIAAQFGYNALFAASAGAGLVAAWLLLHWVAEPRHNPPAPMFAPTKEKQRRLDMSQAYAANWDSLTKHEVPAWFSDSKFGLYAHWGIYAVPGFGNEWYGKWMYDPNHEIHQRHSERFGNPADFGYKDFIAGFTAEHYDADDWADLFTASGARYAGFSLAHHDGFGLWDSDVYRWNVGKMGPRRDLYGELAAALRRRDMRLVAPFHIVRGFNWFLPGWSQWNQRFDQAAVQRGIDEGWDLFDPDYSDFYWVQQTSQFDDFFAQWQAKVREVIDKYQPELMWFDGGKFRDEGFEETALEMLAFYLNRGREWGKDVLVLNKLPVSMQYNFHPDFGVINFESGRDRPANYQRAWNDDMRIGDQSWGWVEGQRYHQGHTLLCKLIDCTARGGTMMLSLSPTPDGRIPRSQREPLLQMGDWLRKYGEAIYETVPYSTHAEGDDSKLIVERRGHKFWEYANCDASDRRYTQSKDGRTIYAMTLGIPRGAVTFAALRTGLGIERVTLLGSDQPVLWTQSPQGLTIQADALRYDNNLAAAWKVQLR